MWIVLIMTDLMNVSGMSAQASNKCMQQACRCRQNSSPPPSCVMIGAIIDTTVKQLASLWSWLLVVNCHRCPEDPQHSRQQTRITACTNMMYTMLKVCVLQVQHMQYPGCHAAQALPTTECTAVPWINPSRDDL